MPSYPPTLDPAATQDRVLALLRQGDRTVQELADGLGISGNAVRLHLAALEREGWIGRGAPRRSGGKPAQTWTIRPEAEARLSRAYAVVLPGLLAELARRLGRGGLVRLLRSVGRNLAGGPAVGDRAARLDRAVAVLGELGGLATLERQGGCYVLQGHGCPLAEAVRGAPETCRLLEAFLAELLGEPVGMECEHGPRPRCRFRVPPER
jgi:predicted ArsR family transcriptional regulator